MQFSLSGGLGLVGPRLGQAHSRKGQQAGPCWPEGHCSRATLGSRRLLGFQSQLSVCSSVWSAVLSGQASVARDLGSGWWHCHLLASGTAPGTSCPSRTLPLTGQGGLVVTLSPKSAIFGGTLAVRTGRQGVGRWGMVSGEYQPGCC